MAVRVNPDSAIELFYPELVDTQQGYVPVVALLPNSNGYQFSLVNNQETILSDTRADIGSILTAITGQLQASISSIDTQLSDPSTGVRTRLNELLTAIANLDGSIDATTTAVDAVDSSIDAIPGQITPSIGAVQTAISANGVKLDAINATLQTPTSLASNPKLINMSTGLTPNTDVTYSFPAGTRKISIKCRADQGAGDQVAPVRYAWESGRAGARSGGATAGYDTIPIGGEYFEENINFSENKTIYLASSVASVWLSVKFWT